ncbi:unnamed protein product [Soboliphyme baturini]|uniref:Isochorismatase domain-containing protein n=1 Tax=Soboliphyme baturini TaxID=241478 RepID=A0A183IVM2_9BILA|nr:unnamed protein product [Soboliphyme baturini]
MTLARGVIQRLSPKNTALLICDMQEQFRNIISFFPSILEVSRRMLEGATLLNVPVLATEQYPRGLGHTVPELNLKKFDVPVFEKTCFSMLKNDNLQKHMNERLSHVKNILICGIESHICVYQSVLDFLEKNYEVHVVVDASSSRSLGDRLFAFRRMEKLGALLTTSECALFELVKDSTNPKFKEIQKLIIDLAPNSGLC